jgi:hypothetical protein
MWKQEGSIKEGTGICQVLSSSFLALPPSLPPSLPRPLCPSTTVWICSNPKNS